MDRIQLKRLRSFSRRVQPFGEFQSYQLGADRHHFQHEDPKGDLPYCLVYYGQGGMQSFVDLQGNRAPRQWVQEAFWYRLAPSFDLLHTESNSSGHFEFHNVPSWGDPSVRWNYRRRGLTEV